MAPAHRALRLSPAALALLHEVPEIVPDSRILLPPQLPREKVDQISSEFFTTKPLGSGMGLAISRSIRNRMAGGCGRQQWRRRNFPFHLADSYDRDIDTSQSFGA